MNNDKVFYSTGRRKTSTARVFLTPGTGEVKINGKPSDKYLPRLSSQKIFVQPLECVDMMGKVNLSVTVKGGGESD